MANVLNRNTKAYFRSVNTPDYPETDWIINPDMSSVVGLENRDIVIDGDVVRPMNTSEKASALAERKIELSRNVALAASEYGSKYFPPEIEIKLKFIHQQALAMGLTNRATYISQALDFEQAVVIEMQTRRDQIAAISDWDELSGSWTDFSTMDAQVPTVTVAGALEITN